MNLIYRISLLIKIIWLPTWEVTVPKNPICRRKELDEMRNAAPIRVPIERAGAGARLWEVIVMGHPLQSAQQVPPANTR